MVVEFAPKVYQTRGTAIRKPYSQAIYSYTNDPTLPWDTMAAGKYVYGRPFKQI